MKRTFISNLRLLAELAREALSNELKVAIQRGYALRETINANFDKVRSLAATGGFDRVMRGPVAGMS